MVSIITDSSTIKDAVGKIIDLTRGAGAEFAPGLVLREENGNLRMETGPDDGPLLVRMPEACLIPPADFRFGLEGDRLMAMAEQGVTPLRAQLMQATLDLYNLTGKLAAHKRSVPWWLAAAHPEVLDHILRLRDNPTLRGYADVVRVGPDDGFLVETFFLTRTLAIKKDGKTMRMLMPVIDFMNHHHQGAAFNTITDQRGFAIGMLKAQPVAGSVECFARYGDYDALTTWLHYGFADEHAPDAPSDGQMIDVSPIYYEDFRKTLEKLRLKNPDLEHARAIALQLCELQLKRLKSRAA